MFRFTTVSFNKFTTFLAASYFTRWLCDPHMTFIIVYGINSSQHMSQIVCFWSVLIMQAAKAQTSLRTSADSSEHSLLAHIELGCRLMLRPKYRPLASIYSCACIYSIIFRICDRYQNEVAKRLFCIISFQTQQLLMTFLRYLFPGRELLLCIALLDVKYYESYHRDGLVLLK